MKRIFHWLALCICFFIMMPTVGFTSTESSSEVKKFVVFPFSVNAPASYKYLEKSIPPMFSSRLHWPGNYEATGSGSSLLQKAPENENEVKKIMKELKADYAVWGSVTIVGEESSLDVSIMDSDGQKWPKSRQARVNQLIPTLTNVCDTINAEVFKRGNVAAVAAPAPQPAQPEAGTAGSGVPAHSMNPGIEYVGNLNADKARMSSQHLPFKCRGMVVCDADGDGKNEIFMIEDYSIHVFSYENKRMVPITKLKTSLSQKNMTIRSYDFDKSGKPRIIITALDGDNLPYSQVYRYEDRKLIMEMDSQPYYLNVINDYSTTRPMLIGQLGDRDNVFRGTGIFEMQRKGNKLVEMQGLGMPDDFNVYNFVFLPAGSDAGNDTKILAVSKMEKLRLYTLGGGRLAESDEVYSGSPVGVEMTSSMHGLADNSATIKPIYYLPMRMIPVDLNKDGNYEVIVNRPISATGHVFSRYRDFLQSEISAVYWDNVGIATLWHTKRIKGAVADFALADMDNDGVIDLVVAINVDNGVVDSEKCMIVGYPLHMAGEMLKKDN